MINKHNLETMIKEIELISKQGCDSTFDHEENTKSKRDAHFRGLIRGKISMAKACMIVINQLRENQHDKL
jgi:hypothetical protein